MRDPNAVWPEATEAEIQAVLSRYDEIFTAFAHDIGGYFQSNYHNHPSRDIVAEDSDGIVRKISLTSVLSRNSKFALKNWCLALAIMAWKDTPQGRLSWLNRPSSILFQDPPAPEALQQEIKRAWSGLKILSESAFLPRK